MNLPGQNACYDRKPDTRDHWDGSKGAQREHDDFVFCTVVHRKLHSFGTQRLNGGWVSYKTAVLYARLRQPVGTHPAPGSICRRRTYCCPGPSNPWRGRTVRQSHDRGEAPGRQEAQTPKDRRKKGRGRKSLSEIRPDAVALARRLSEQRPRLSLREISAELATHGFTTPRGLPYSASAVTSMLAA